MKNQAIQGLRVVFLIGIFLKHLHDSIGFPYIIDFGARGVEFFFVLSGFLTGIKINYKELSLQSCFSFLFHKLRKFYPLHVLMFLISIPLVILYTDKDYFNLLITAFLNVLLLQSWFDFSQWSYNGVSWFLSALLFCYFSSPIISFICSNLSKRKIIIITFLVYVLKNILDTIHFLYFNPAYRLMEYFISFNLGFLFRENLYDKEGLKFKEHKFNDILQVFYFFILIAALFIGDKKWLSVNFIFIYIGLIYLMFSKGVVHNILSSQAFNRGGQISLEFFMSHYIVINYVTILYEKLELSNNLKIIIISIFSFILTIIFSIFLQKLNKFISCRKEKYKNAPI